MPRETKKKKQTSGFFRRFFARKVLVFRWQFNVVSLFFLFSGAVFGFYLTLSGVIPKIFAADTADTWNFSVSDDYTPSDAALVEVASSTARLKVQNYTSDADTVALFHLDESSGSTADDASSNANDGAVTGATFGAGNLNNALTFDGNSDFVSVPDSASLSLSQDNTLEAWTKFDTTFSAGSHDNNQGVIDKGDYRLFYNYNTGKIQYELADGSETTWTQQAGNDINDSWDLNGKISIESQTVIDDTLYVGLGNAIGDAEVWSWDGTIWTQIGGDGLNSSWADQTFEGVYSLTTDGTNIYAGLGATAGDAEVWRWNGSTWSRIGGDAINSSWAVSTFEVVYSMSYFDDTLYAGLGSTANDAEVWSWNGSAWTKIGGDSLNSGWTTNFEYVYQMVNDGTNLYVGLGLTAGDAEVWSWNGSAWTRIGGDAVNSSWANSTFETVTSMLYQGSTLYVGLGTTAGDADLWSYTSGTWTQIGGDALNSGWAGSTYEAVYSLRGDGTNVYAGLGATAGDNEVWSWNGSAWTKIGGDAINSGFTNTHTIVSTLSYVGTTLYAGLTGSVSSEVWAYSGGVWTQVGGNYYNHSWGFFNLQSVESMTTYSDKLYAGTGLTVAGNALVWEFDGSTWTLIGGQGVNSSWAGKTFESVTSMISDGGNLYVGLGTTANDAEVWRWNGSAWTKIGGDSLNSGWTTNYESVLSMAVYQGDLHVGLGVSANDAEVWRWNGSAWTKIGGDSTNSGWTTNYESVLSMAVYEDYLYAGLGVTAGDSEVWRWNGTVWGKVGGDGINSGWDNTIEDVDYMIVYNGSLYAGLGVTAGDADVWSWNGSAWTQVGGDDLNGSWTAGTYEQVKTMTVYNGKLIAGLGNTAGDGEVWEYSGGTWIKIAGNTLNSSWANTIELVTSFSVYSGKLFAGTGNTANADAGVWSYGQNGVLQSTTVGQDTNWHHIAATYDGATMKLYIDGVLDNSVSQSLSMADGSSSLYIGTTGGGRESGIAQGYFDGSIDEVRISNIDRSSFNTTPYTSSPVGVRPTSAIRLSGVKSWDTFTTDEAANGGTITYRLSDDGGTTWKYWSGAAWATSSSLSESNSAAVINTNIPTFPVTDDGFLWQAVLDGDGNQLVTLNEVIMESTADVVAPVAPSSLTALNESGGLTSLTTDTWYTYAAPYFSWSGASDTGGSGVGGYYVYFGTDNTADPQTAGAFQVGSTYTASSLTSGQTYYLRIRARDNAQNVSSVYAAFVYKLDTVGPQNPSGVTVAPTGYSSTNDFTFFWTATSSDASSGVAGYQYQVNESVDADDWSSTTASTSVNLPGAAYQTGANYFYLRTLDNAGNVSSTTVQVAFYYAGSGPTAPQNLDATPATNTVNSFAFSWDPPSSYSGDEEDLTYCYTVNTLPSEITCSFTSAGATSLSASAFATQVGTNTFYVVAKNHDDVGGAINYGAYDSIEFTANTSAPGIPLSIEIADVSVKSTSSWKIALSWEAPSSGTVDEYQIYRSTDGTTYSYSAATTGIAFVDTGLSQTTYYYKVRACDNVQNCGSYSTSVELLPSGRFTSAAELSAEPKVSAITTRAATIAWSTDRASDSKIQYGKSARSYYSEEPSNSDQLTDHEIHLTNLSPGTRYYFKAKWTDEDGNTGVSTEDSFETTPAPTVTDPTAKTIGLSDVVLEFTVENANTVKIYYGTTSSFGSVKEIATSTTKTAYNVTLDELQDGTKYYYKVNTLDSEEEEYDGSTLSFETLPRPKISNARIQQVRGSAQTVMLISWSTNTDTSSIVSYYPDGRPEELRDEVNVKLLKGEHKMMIRNLLPQMPYTLIVKGRDKAGNEAKSDPQHFTTATDTRPPQISEVNVEGTVATRGGKNSEAEAEAQLVVSWTTDEQSTSQVEYGEGTGATYAQKTQEDTNLVTNHTVIISGLTPSKVYHLRIISRDKAGNVGNSIDTVAITPKATANALDLVVTSLRSILGQ